MAYFTPEVIVISADGENLGRMHVSKAKQLAYEHGLDLIEISKQGNNSVCKIIDKGKWEYEQKKKKKNQEHSHVHKVKEMKFGVRIDPHDQEIKLNHIKRFLSKKMSVKIVIEISGREKSRPEAAEEKMNEILTALENLIKKEEVKKSNNGVSLLVHPI